MAVEPLPTAAATIIRHSGHVVMCASTTSRCSGSSVCSTIAIKTLSSGQLTVPCGRWYLSR